MYLDPFDDNLFVIQDAQWGTWIRLPRELAENPMFDVADWYEGQLIQSLEFFVNPDPPPLSKSGRKPDDDVGGSCAFNIRTRLEPPCGTSTNNALVLKTSLEMDQWNGRNQQINGLQVPHGVYPAVQRNAAVTKDLTHTIP